KRRTVRRAGRIDLPVRDAKLARSSGKRSAGGLVIRRPDYAKVRMDVPGARVRHSDGPSLLRGGGSRTPGSARLFGLRFAALERVLQRLDAVHDRAETVAEAGQAVFHPRRHLGV